MSWGLLTLCGGAIAVFSSPVVLLLLQLETSKFFRPLPARMPHVHSACGSSSPGSASEISPESSPPLIPSMALTQASIIFSWTTVASSTHLSALQPARPPNIPCTLLPEHDRIAPAYTVLSLALPGATTSLLWHTGPCRVGLLLPRGWLPAIISTCSLNVPRCFTSLSYSSFCLGCSCPHPTPTPTPGLQSPGRPLRLCSRYLLCL